MALLQATVFPALYRSHYLLVPPSRRIRPLARTRLKIEQDIADLTSRGWLKTGLDVVGPDAREFHLVCVSARPVRDGTMLYSGRLTNWLTGLSTYRPGGYPSANVLLGASPPDSIEGLRVPVSPPYDPDFVEDIRIFESFGSCWGIGSVRTIAKDRTRPVVVRFAPGERPLAADRVLVLDETALGGKLPLHADEKNWTPVPVSATEIHFIQNHLKGSVVALDTVTLQASVLRIAPAAATHPDAAGLRIPSCPVPHRRGRDELLLSLGHKKLEGYYNHRIWTRSSFYRTYAVLMQAAAPHTIVDVSRPLYFDITPPSYVFPFQLIDLPSETGRLLVSLYIGGRHNELLTIEKQHLLDALAANAERQ